MKRIFSLLLSLFTILPAHAQEEKPTYTLPPREELRQQLTEEQWHVTQEKGTERAFTGQYWDEFGKGIYVDITTGEPLFYSFDKYDAGCGWPSFTKPINKQVVRENLDTSYGMMRMEVVSALSDAHLGHVFTDGPMEKGGLRYCINSASLRFVPYDTMEEAGYGWLIAAFDQEEQGE